jgi:hypothetical protein
LGEGNRWSPADLDASVAVASCWLIRAQALDKIGGWRMSQKDRAEPSQALLFRLWRRGFPIHTLNDLTLIVIAAGHRANAYLQREAPEHDWDAVLAFGLSGYWSADLDVSETAGCASKLRFSRSAAR